MPIDNTEPLEKGTGIVKWSAKTWLCGKMDSIRQATKRHEIRVYPSAKHQFGRISTLYKRKDKKVRPVDLGRSDGSVPSGTEN